MENTAQDAQFAAEFNADIDVEKLAEIYAEALLNAADEAKVSSEETIEEFESFIGLFAGQPTFETVLSSAMVQTEEKLALLEKAVSGKASPLFWNFLKIVAKRDRLDILKPIYRASKELLDQRRGRVPVTITTATELDGSLLDSLSEKLRGVLGGEPVIHNVVDPETIGGLVVRVGDTIYDASILTQLKNVRQQMIDRSAHEIQCRRDSFRNPEGN